MTVTVAFDGEYDLASQRDVKRKLASVEAEPEIVLDLTSASYIDSSCVAELLLFNRARRARGLPPETILATAGPVAKVLEVAGVAKVCRVVTQSH